MELLLKSKQENKALGRQDLTCGLSFDKAMPSRKEIREALCASVGADPSLLVIVSAKGSFGSKQAVVLARLYKDKEAMKVERKHLLVRDALAQKEGKKAAKAAPAKK